MKKFLVLVSFLAILLVACSSSPTSKAEGKWQNEDGDIITIKGNELKVTSGGMSVEGSIKDDDDHKDLAKINLVGEKGYIKPDKDDKNVIYALDKADETPDSTSKFKKIK